MTVRLFIAAAAVLGIYAGGELFKDRGMPTEPAHLQLDLDQLPRKFNAMERRRKTIRSWIRKCFRLSAQEQAINRRYRDGRAEVDLHCDVFLKYGVRVLHPPELCYTSNGFAIANSETVEIYADGMRSFPARLLSLDHDGLRVYCLYWYQFGDVTFWTGDDQRRVVHSFRGKEAWPPMIKVMLQTSANSPDEALGRLKSLAAQVYQLGPANTTNRLLQRIVRLVAPGPIRAVMLRL